MTETTWALQAEIKNLAGRFYQAIHEVDGLLSDAQDILNKFSAQNWSELKNLITTWTNRELKVLAWALSSGDRNGELVEDNYFYGYIFTLVDDETAASLLDDAFNFIESEITSSQLLMSMISRVESL